MNFHDTFGYINLFVRLETFDGGCTNPMTAICKIVVHFNVICKMKKNLQH